ncbi:hypothetical protein F5Y03DRAFT_378428 [Xylaria venustula]|nr:hypothetical protein F5Y03DRAFT_378428 [Xylaria venustula]
MPPFFDRVQLHQAVTSQAIPMLEAIAANDNLRSLRRFERDDPPPYTSSTESEEPEDADLIPQPRGGPMPEELKATIERPFDDVELDDIAFSLESIVYPDHFYYTEAKREHYRLDNRRRGPRPEMFRGLNGVRRQGVIVRHNVKRRWEKLGVWNPEWGFAGRKMQPNDRIRTWKWTWQHHDRPAGMDLDARELVARALLLRRNLRRGEHAPVLPRSCPRQDTTTAQAEAFLISRPWFIFQVEMAEERQRYRRLSIEDEARYPHSTRNQVIQWWKERGDWRDEFNRTSWVTAWKWRHESPSPEPEDLTHIDIMRDSPLEAAEEMEFTPSEIDELETIELPESEQPEGFWVIKNGDLPPFFPGQMHDVHAEIRERQKKRAESLERARAEGREIPVDPVVQALIKKVFPGPGPFRIFGSPPAVQHDKSSPEQRGASIELQEDTFEPQREAACPPPQRQRRLRQRQPRDGLDGPPDQDQPLTPQPRRSARIAGMKRPAEPIPSQTAPNKRPRGRVAPQAAASATQPTRQETRPKRGRGRPRKENGPSIRSAVRKGPERTPATAGTRSDRAAGTNVPSVPRRRGRPRKYE